MTIRVELSIIPFGDEDKKRVIETLNVSNIGRIGFDEFTYVIEHNKYKEYTDDTPRVDHFRADGALTLTKKAIERLGY